MEWFGHLKVPSDVKLNETLKADYQNLSEEQFFNLSLQELFPFACKMNVE